jgi:hypothetical protein
MLFRAIPVNDVCDVRAGTLTTGSSQIVAGVQQLYRRNGELQTKRQRAFGQNF